MKWKKLRLLLLLFSMIIIAAIVFFQYYITGIPERNNDFGLVTAISIIPLLAFAVMDFIMFRCDSCGKYLGRDFKRFCSNCGKKN